jgi:hypothetical protein
MRSLAKLMQMVLTLPSGWVKVRRVISESRHFPHLQIILSLFLPWCRHHNLGQISPSRDLTSKRVLEIVKRGYEVTGFQVPQKVLRALWRANVTVTELLQHLQNLPLMSGPILQRKMEETTLG